METLTESRRPEKMHAESARDRIGAEAACGRCDFGHFVETERKLAAASARPLWHLLL